MPSSGNPTGGSPYSFSQAHLAPLPSVTHHSASRTLTTNQPSVTGVSPDPESSSRASGTTRLSHGSRDRAVRDTSPVSGGTPSLFDHVALPVSDVARSRAFYERALLPFGV